MHKFFKKLVGGIAAVAAAVSLCGCNVKLPFMGDPLDFNKSYTVNAEISCDRLTAKAKVTRAGANDWEFAFTEPKELNGIKIAFGVNGYNAMLGDLNFRVSGNETYTMLPKLIGGTLEQLAVTPSESFTQKDGVVTADVDVDGRTVTVNAGEKGDLISLKSPYHKLLVTFSEQKPYVSPYPDEGGLIGSQ